MLCFASDIDIVGGRKAIFAIEPDQGPVWIRCIVDRECSFFGERELLVGLPAVVV